MISSIRGNVIYQFDYNFQQDIIKFEFNDINDRFTCYPSTFPLVKDRENDDEKGVYFERINDVIYLRGFDISSEDIDLTDDLHFFYGWKEIYEEYQNWILDPEESGDDV